MSSDPTERAEDSTPSAAPSNSKVDQRPRRFWSRAMLLIRRIHLYTGLFLLPWVLLYGITGAMFNHQWLFPRAQMQSLEPDILDGSAMDRFPSTAELAQQVVEAISLASDEKLTLSERHSAEFTNDVMFEVNQGKNRYVAQIDPIDHSAKLIKHPPNDEQPEIAIENVHNIKLSPDPHEFARSAAQVVLEKAKIETSQQPRPLGWTKLNFIAEMKGQPVRVTYVLKDGHVDITKYTGEDGMPVRQFFLRLHTSHGQSPHWNGRNFWSIIVDAMAIAMVCWGVSGILMWWQIKRTRLLGTTILLLSMASASILYLTMHDFYATTKL